MTLQWQQVELNLGASMDQATVPFALPPNLLQELRNARVYKNGAVGKRPGWAAKAATSGDRVLSVDGEVFTLKAHTPFAGTVGAALELGTLNNEAARVDYQGGNLGPRSLSEIEVLDRHTLIRDVVAGGLALISSDPDFAVSADQTIAVIAWEASLVATPTTPAQIVVMAMAIDVRTRALVTLPTQISANAGTNNRPSVLLNDSTSIVVTWARPGSNQIRGVIYNTTTRTFGADTLIGSNLNASGRMDAREYVGGTGWYLIYQDTTPVVAFAQMSGVTVLAANSIAENPDAGGLAVYADSASATLWLAWYNTVSGLRAAIRSATALGTVVLAPTTMETAVDVAWSITWAPGVGVNILIWTTAATNSLSGSNYGRRLSKFRTLSQAGAKGNQVSVCDVTLISKGYSAPNGFTYAAFIYDAGADSDLLVEGLRSQQNQVAFTMMVCDTQLASTGFASNSWRVAAVWAYGEAGRVRRPSSLTAFRSVQVDATDPINEQWFMLAPEFDPIVSQTFPGESFGCPGVDLCRQRITTEAPIFGARIGRLIVFSGGVPHVWDGASLVEYGFYYPPENSKVTDSGAGGSLSGGGTYSTQVVWEYRHATGDVARSAPSFSFFTPGVTSVPVPAVNDKLTVTLPSLGNTRKWNDNSTAEGVMARVYRTEANGTIWYAEGDYSTTNGFAASVVTGFAGYVLSTTVTQADTLAITHTNLYTTDGILPNLPPPALSYIHTHRNRLFGVAAENRHQVVFTHEYTPGELPGWHPDLVIDVPDEAVALATVDEKLIILCRNGIYLIAGNGPDRKGLNSDYDQPFRLNSPHGCMTAESVASFPNGVLYQARTGFCLVDRQTTVTRIGGPVEDVLATYPFAHAAAVLEDREWIYWALTDTKYLDASTVGRSVCFDWRHNVWSLDAIAGSGGFTFATSFAQRGTDLYCAVNGDSHVYHQEGSADPGPSWIYTYLRTAMLHLGSNSKFQRARWLTLLGEQRGIHQLGLTVTTFHHAASAGLTQSFLWTEAQLVAMQNYALKMHLANQIGAFVQVEISDGPDLANPLIFDDSARFVTLLLDVGLKRGTFQAAQAGME